MMTTRDNIACQLFERVWNGNDAAAILYAETSGVLAWLLGEPDASRVRKALAGATTVVSSDLTLVDAIAC